MTVISPAIRIWSRENRISSDGETVISAILGLPENALELYGSMVKVDGKTKLNGLFYYEPFFEGSNRLTKDGFDQVQLYQSLYNLQDDLGRLGIDVQSILASDHGGRRHPIVAHANATPDLNAWYSPQNDDLTFGTNKNKWHLASDSDITSHEAGHMILDHINKLLGVWSDRGVGIMDEGAPEGWSRGEGGAIHEGFGDVLAALLYNDPEMSEDFVPFLGRGESKKDGLRNVDNNLGLKDVSTEVHDRGQVYAGFFWAIKKYLMSDDRPFPLSDREAADLTLKILMAHASNYRTGRPTPKDFVDAVLNGVDGLASVLQLGVDRNELKSFITNEAVKRGLNANISPLPDEWDDIFTSYADFEKKFGNDLLFTPAQKTEYLGGTQEIYQQQYKTSRGEVVDLVGRALIVNKDARGNVVSVSARDVLPVKEGGINEGTNVSFRTASTIALADAQKKYYSTKRAMMAANPAQFRNNDQYYDYLAKNQMDYRIAEAAVNSLNTAKFTETPKMVVLPNSNDLHYEMKVGMAIYYVNTRTGEATFKKDVFI
ncbi:MAG: hypothetical protein HYU98_04610 [Deltaproteobacteria bacterium]|nr:hypothetical protein [Deltaproteobacteria bacterium]